MKKIPLLMVFISFIGIIVFYSVGESTRVQSTQDAIAFIYEHYNNAGELIDYQNEISMINPDKDIKLYVKDDEVTIHFGKMLLNWKMAEFVEPVNLENLKKIHITAFKDKNTGRLRLFYKGKEIQRWVS